MSLAQDPRYRAEFWGEKPGYLVTRAGFLIIPARFKLVLPSPTVTLLNKTGELLYEIRPRAIHVFPGYWWDGATCALEAKGFRLASLYHDVLCQAIDIGQINPANQKKADKIMLHICLQKKFNRCRAYTRYYAVRRYRELKVKDYKWPRED